MVPRAPAQWARALLGTLGALMAAAGALVALCWGDVFDLILARELELSPSSSAFDEWRSPSFPLYFDIYLFNWTNPEEFALGGERWRPRLQQLGPYRYRETREKVDLVWHAHNRSVSYRTLRRWYFEPLASNGSLDDNVTTLNVIAASAVYRARDWSYLRQKGLSMGLALFRQQVWVRRSARELLFAGYEDPLLELARSMPPSATGGAPPVDRFGWFYERNGSLLNDGHMNVGTGAGAGTAAPGQILRWNHRDSLAYFSPPCDELAGSLGEFFPRRLSPAASPAASAAPADTLTLFSPDLCRPLRFTFERRREVHGVPVLHYAAAQRMLDNGSVYPENACGCGARAGDECVPAGALNVSSCRFGSPAFISLPHFLRADPHYAAAVRGLRPDPRAHSFYIALEPTTGVPLDVAARFQLNILVAPSVNVALYEKVPRVMFPVLWVEQRVLVPPAVARALGAARAAAAWGALAAAAFAGVGLALALLAWAAPRCLRRPPSPSPPPPVAPAARPEELDALVPTRGVEREVRVRTPAWTNN